MRLCGVGCDHAAIEYLSYQQCEAPPRPFSPEGPHPLGYVLWKAVYHSWAPSGIQHHPSYRCGRCMNEWGVYRRVFVLSDGGFHRFDDPSLYLRSSGPEAVDVPPWYRTLMQGHSFLACWTGGRFPVGVKGYWICGCRRPFPHHRRPPNIPVPDGVGFTWGLPRIPDPNAERDMLAADPLLASKYNVEVEPHGLVYAGKSVDLLLGMATVQEHGAFLLCFRRASLRRARNTRTR